MDAKQDNGIKITHYFFVYFIQYIPYRKIFQIQMSELNYTWI